MKDFYKLKSQETLSICQPSKGKKSPKLEEFGPHLDVKMKKSSRTSITISCCLQSKFDEILMTLLWISYVTLLKNKKTSLVSKIRVNKVLAIIKAPDQNFLLAYGVHQYLGGDMLWSSSKILNEQFLRKKQTKNLKNIKSFKGLFPIILLLSLTLFNCPDSYKPGSQKSRLKSYKQIYLFLQISCLFRIMSCY